MLPLSPLLHIVAMAGMIPGIWGQSSVSSSSVAPATSVVGTTRSVSSSAAATSSSAAVAPRIIFDRIDTLVACDDAEVSWEVFGIFGGLYEVNLFAIDANTPMSSSASSTASVSARSVAPSSSSSSAAASSTSAAARTLTPSSVSVSSSASAARSTALVGRALQVRQTSTPLNTTLVAGHAADEPYSFTVPLPAGAYYLVATMNDPLRTTTRSNVFTVIERDDTSCLAAANGQGSSSSRTSITGGVMQTPGAGSTDSSTSSGPSGGAIAGIVVGVIGGLAILAVAFLLCIRRRRRAARAASTDRFAALPSASSQDGQYGSGALPVAGMYRRDSDPDEKDVEAAQSQDDHPYAARQQREELRSPDSGSIPALGDHRKQSGPPTTHTLVPKTSMQGIIGKASDSHESSANHSRCSSAGAADAVPAASAGKEVGRSTSTKRKPVPSLGPELRGELQREKQRQMSETRERERMPSVSGAGAGERRSYSLVPDPLPPQSRP